jgi:hypothetical protein
LIDGVTVVQLVAAGEGGKGGKDTEPVGSFAKVRVAYKTAYSFCYLHSFCANEKQNIFCLELPLLYL